jgi:hypothetical protein
MAYGDDPKDRSGLSSEEKLLKELRERFDYAWDEWKDIRDEAAIDMRYVSGDPWDPKDRADRKLAGRPCLSLDELGQYHNQVINGVRANPRAVKFSPNGNGSTDKSAEWYADKMREIEYRSHAQVAYTTAFQDAVHRGYGFARLKTKYESDRSFNQELWIEPVANADQVLPDPDAKRPDSSDMKYCFVFEQRTHEEFRREFGATAKLVDFESFSGELGFTHWVDDKKVTIAEYWTIKVKPRKLLMIQPPPPPRGLGQPPAAALKPLEVFEDELDLKSLPDGARRVKDRMVEWPSVCQYLTNGVQILSTTEWPGKYIPIVSCYGMVLYVNGKRKIMSMTRLARDPFMLYCYYRTCEAELVGMTPKFPYFTYEDQISAEELTNLQKSLHEPVAVIRVKATIDSAPSQVLPFPSRQPYEPPIQGLEIGAESTRRGIQAAMMGSPLPTQAQRHNEKSGKALQQIDSSAQRGSFHLNDHYDDMVRQFGVMNEDIFPHIYDTARQIATRKATEDAVTTTVNDPSNPDSIDIKGDHLVTVSTGPNFDSQRDKESDFADTLMQSPFAPVIADLAVKLKGGGATMDEIARRLTPPQFAKQGSDGKPLSPEAQQAMSENAQLKQKVQEFGQLLQTDKLKTDSQERIAQWKIASEERQAALDRETKLAVAELGAKVDRLSLFMEERGRVGDQQATMDQQHVQQAHDVGTTAMEHQQALEAAQQAHQHAMAQGQAGMAQDAALAEQGQQHALEQGQQGHEQALQQGQQAADLAPQPEAGA